MTMHLDTVAAPVTSDTIGGTEWQIPYLDPDTSALTAEVDAIV